MSPPDPTGTAAPQRLEPALGGLPSSTGSSAGTPAWQRGELWAFLALAVGYFAGGMWLSLSEDSLMSDALSRTANGYYPLFSRDPHLAAVGFVWNPLPSFVQMPLLPLAQVWPEVASRGLAAIAQSAVFMAGAVAQLRGGLRELRVGRRAAWVLTALFALHPEIAYYGMNGMSEASFLFFLLLATRQLIRWTRTGTANPLAGAGLALGAAYLTRYEAVAAGLGATVFAAGFGYARAAGVPATRRAAAAADAIVVAVPFVFSVAAWAVTSWLVVGSPFAQFTSQDGNTAQTRTFASGISTVIDQSGGPLGYLLDQSRLLEPFGLLLLAGALIVSWRRRDVAVLAAVFVLGGAYGFTVLALLAGQTFGWLRFSIVLVPLTTLAAGVLLAAHPVASPPSRSGGRLSGRRRQAVHAGVCLLLAAALPASAVGLFDPRLAREESYFLTGVFTPDRATAAQRGVLHRYEQDRSVAGWLDAQHLPSGAVLLDAADGYSVVLSSRRPDQFAITTDPDFGLLLGDPRAHRVRYLVTRSAEEGAPADAIRRAYRDIDNDPAFRLVRVERNAGDLPSWRVYATR